MPPPTRAKRRMDKLMRHLTAQPASDSQSPSKLPTPQKIELRRELASAQKDRVKREYGYEITDDANEPIIQVSSDCDDENDRIPFKRLRVAIQDDIYEGSDPIEVARLKLARACRLACIYEVAGSRTDEDLASIYIPQEGYLYKPLGIRFDEMVPENFILTRRRDELPKIHADLYAAHPTNKELCILSAAHSECCLVSITKEGLLPICQDAVRLYGRIRRVDDQNLGMRASRSSYRGTTVWLVKNRGVICCEGSVEAALALLVLTARSCAFQVRALSAVGGDLSRLECPTESEVIKLKADLMQRLSDDEVAASLFDKRTT